MVKAHPGVYTEFRFPSTRMDGGHGPVLLNNGLAGYHLTALTGRANLEDPEMRITVPGWQTLFTSHP